MSLPNPWLIIAVIVVIAAAGFKGYTHGRSVEQGIAATAERDSQRLADAIRQRLERANATLSLDLATARAARQGRDRIITKEVYRYVEVTPAADRVSLPGTWRVRHDAAATGEPAEPGRLAAGAAEPVTDAAALETVADNYATCRDWRDQLVGWQRWWDDIGQHCTGVAP